jgi:hypothetical protein
LQSKFFLTVLLKYYFYFYTTMFKPFNFIIVFCLVLIMGFKSHPFFVTVTEVEHNKQTQNIEVSIKIFTDDFEKTLRKNYKVKIDLLNNATHSNMDAYVKAYVSNRFSLNANGQNLALTYIGYEQIEEAIYCYFEATKVPTIKTLQIKNSLLFDYTSKQTSVVHCKANNKLQSAKNNHPNADFLFSW